MYAGFFAVRDRGTDPVKFTIKSTPFKGRLESVFKRSQEIEEGEEVADVTRPGTAAPAAAKAGMPKSAGSGSARDSKIEGKTVEAAAGATTRGSGASGREFELGKAKGAAAAAKSAAGRDAAAVQGGAGSEIAGGSGTQKPKRRREEVEEGEILSDDDEEPGELVISCSRRSPREIVDHYGRKKAKHAGMMSVYRFEVGCFPCRFRAQNARTACPTGRLITPTADRKRVPTGPKRWIRRLGGHRWREQTGSPSIKTEIRQGVTKTYVCRSTLQAAPVRLSLYFSFFFLLLCDYASFPLPPSTHPRSPWRSISTSLVYHERRRSGPRARKTGPVGLRNAASHLLVVGGRRGRKIRPRRAAAGPPADNLRRVGPGPLSDRRLSGTVGPRRGRRATACRAARGTSSTDGLESYLRAATTLIGALGGGGTTATSGEITGVGIRGLNAEVGNSIRAATSDRLGQVQAVWPTPASLTWARPPILVVPNFRFPESGDDAKIRRFSGPRLQPFRVRSSRRSGSCRLRPTETQRTARRSAASARRAEAARTASAGGTKAERAASERRRICKRCSSC
ncbi:MAG: hypothetical protein BJ554DRAFT_1765 [Olpidium bornovanus]|uniref:Uncharacterized protein n=1 Tax=Olpidium bornovanus TaxID=278681 RepID=A0A8H7ZRY0_9FUNG|nr:MAG: hypothetical protein BJ554DRAFT_1765 [Olpidium bornovanus]